MSDEEQKRKEQFAALKRHLEQEQARVDREMPGATAKEKSDAVVAKLSESLRVNREKKVIESRTAVLRGKKLQRAQNQPDRDYSGGGFYYEESEILHLFVDHTFHYEKRKFSSVSGRGVSLPPLSARGPRKELGGGDNRRRSPASRFENKRGSVPELADQRWRSRRALPR